MTTIAYKDNIIVGDCSVWRDDKLMGTTDKIYVFEHDGNKYYVATAGGLSEASLFREWLQKSLDDPKLKSPLKAADDDFEAMVFKVDADNELTIIHYDNRLAQTFVQHAFYAIGSGAEIATGAMAAGASAEKAVIITADYDAFTIKDTQVIKIR